MSPTSVPIDSRVTASGAEGVANINDTLSNLSINGEGVLADRVREVLARNAKHAQMLSDAAAAVHQSTLKYEQNAADFDAANPTDEEIAQAQQEVVDAANRAADGTGSEEDVQKAVDKLAKLLAAREKAKKDREDADGNAQDDLKSDTEDFRDPSKNPGLEDMQNQQQPQMPQPAGGQPMGGGSPGGGDPGVGANPSPYDPQFSNANDLGGYPSDDVPDFDDMTNPYGSTELSGAEDGVMQDPTGQNPSTVNGVRTAADISGKTAQPIAVNPSVPGAPGPAGGGGGMPMGGMPMGGMGAPGGGAGKGKDRPKILTDDPYLKGTDLMDEHSSPGDVTLDR